MNPFNDYGYIPQDVWIGRDKQLKDAGYDTSGVEKTFGKGIYNNGQFAQYDKNDGMFMSYEEQLKSLGLDPSQYELVYGKGYVKENGGDTPAEPKCLTFTAVDGSATLYLKSETYSTFPSLEVSTDNGETWNEYTSDDGYGEQIEIEENQSVMFRGINETINSESNERFVFYVDEGGYVAASGDVTSLLNGIGGDVAVPEYCYSGIFSGCEGLTTAPNLPSTTLAPHCYEGMFSSCTSLTTAPELPATTLAEGCYSAMFSGCTSLANAPALPATTLVPYCYGGGYEGYGGMFSGCTSLVNAPALPATTLAPYCYGGMFYDCWSLTTAPVLPATTLAEGCYSYMFYGCSGLTTAPVLPATTLAEGCYAYMFNDCYGLTTAPELPATTLVDYCYANMFENCSSLNYVKAMFLTEPNTSYTNAWLYYVSNSGTFVKNANATWDLTGPNGIPSGWIVETA